MQKSGKSIGFITTVAVAIAILASFSGFFQEQDGASSKILQAGTGSIWVKVVDEANSPIENATITIAGNSTYSNFTDSNGNVLISNLSDGNYTINAMKNGYANDTISVPVVAPSTSNRTLRLGAGLLWGLVTSSDSSNTPITGAKIRISGWAVFGFFERENFSRSAGDYFIRGIPLGAYSITVTAPGYQSGNGSLQINSTSDIVFRPFKLGHTFGTISGKISENNISIPDANVFVLVNDQTRQVSTDADGKYSLTDIPAGVYNVTAFKDGYFDAHKSNVTVENGVETAGTNLNLTSRPGRLFGTVSSGSFLVSNAKVEILGAGLGVFTGSEGNYSIDNVLHGSYFVQTTASGYEQNVTSEIAIERGKDKELNIKLIAEPGQLYGVIRSAKDLSVVPGCNITIRGGSEVRQTVANKTGEYFFPGLPPGEYTIEARATGFAPYIESGIVIASDNENPAPHNIELQLAKEALGGFVFGMDLAHSFMALGFVMIIVILAAAVYLRLRGLQHPEKPPAVFEEEELEEGEEEEESDEDIST